MEQVKIFYSYSHKDETLRKKLDDHLAFLKRDAVNMWYDRELIAGHVLDESIQRQLNDSDIILLLVSSSFLSSFYCYDVEMKMAMLRHDAKKAIVVPVLLSDCVWKNAPFAKLLMTPEDAKPIDNSKYWSTIDEAFTNVANALDKTVKWVRDNKTATKATLITSDVDIVKAENKLSSAPVPKPYFTGRDNEILEFKKAIDEGVNFIAIDGPGGIGKTQFVSRCIEEHIPSDKIIWYTCTSASQLDTLISEAGYPDLLKGTSKTDREKFSAFKDKIQEEGYFLFLDNFQETNSTPLFKEFLIFIQEYLKKGAVIVIDRDNINNVNLTPRRIHIEGFKEKKLEYAKALISNSYKDRVIIVDKDLENLCEQLEGYPLAINLAVNLLSLGETSTNIIEKIVHGGEGDQISERLLNAIFTRPDATEEEKEFIKQFSVFTGTVNDQAVNAVISEKLISSARSKLQRKNLLSYSNGRYEIHPLVREFCYDKLVDKEVVHSRIADFFITQRAVKLDPTLEEQVFYHLSKAGLWEKIENEIEEKGRLFILQGQLSLVKELLDKLRLIPIEKPIFNILYGDIAELQGNWDLAQKYYGYARLNEIDNQVRVEGIIKYGEMIHKKGRVKEALTYYEEANKFSKEFDFLKEEARALNDIGLVDNYFGDLDSAFEKFNEALQIREKIDDNDGIASSLSNIGSIKETQGELELALNYFEKSLNLCLEIKTLEGIGFANNRIGKVWESKGDINKALNYYKQSLKIYKEIGNKEGIGNSLNLIGTIHRLKTDFTKALDCFNMALEIRKELGDQLAISNSIGLIGNIHLDKNNSMKALEYQEEALKLLEGLGFKASIAASLGSIGSTYQFRGELEKALNYFEKSLKIKEEIGDKQGIAVSLAKIGGIYSTDYRKQYALAIGYFIRSLSLSNKIGLKPLSDSVILSLLTIRDKGKVMPEKFKEFVNDRYSLLDQDMKKFIPLKEILKEPIIRTEPKLGRNDPCHCGSGKKYKHCHGVN